MPDLRGAMQLTLRPATDGDKEFLYTLNRAAYRALVERQFGEWDDAWQRRYFEEKWERADYQIIERAGRPIGTVWIAYHDDHVLLHEIQILPEFQGQGIGTALLREELERARGKGVPIRLRVLKQNRARFLYERLGFVVYGETEAHFLMESAGGT